MSDALRRIVEEAIETYREFCHEDVAESFAKRALAALEAAESADDESPAHAGATAALERAGFNEPVPAAGGWAGDRCRECRTPVGVGRETCDDCAGPEDPTILPRSPIIARARCFHVEAGRPCTRYSEGSANEQQLVVRYLLEKASGSWAGSSALMRAFAATAEEIRAGAHMGQVPAPVPGAYPCCEGARRVEAVPGDATTLLGGWCPVHGVTRHAPARRE